MKLLRTIGLLFGSMVVALPPFTGALAQSAPAIPMEGLALWLRGDAGVELNGSAVTQWTDQSSHQRHAVQSNQASRPEMSTESSTGLPVIQFDGLDDFLSFTLPLNGLHGVTLFLVAADTGTETSSPGPQNAALFWNEIQSWGTLYLSPFQDTVGWSFGTTQPGNQAVWTRPAPLGNAFTLTSALKNGSIETLYVNGAFAMSASGQWSPVAGCRDTASLGRGYNDNTYYAGQIAEVLVYTRALTVPERMTVEQYLDTKYQISPPSAPGFVTQPLTQIVVGSAYEYVVSASGNPTPSYSLARAPGGMVIDPNTGVISWLPAPGDGGIHAVEIEATNTLGTARQSFFLSVLQCPTNILSSWSMEVVQAGTIRDTMGLSHLNCVSSSCPVSTPAIVGQGLLFNAATKMSTAYQSSLNFSNEGSFTLELWVRTETLGVTAYFGRIDPSTMMEFSLGQDGDARPWFYLRDGEDGMLSTLIDPNDAPALGTWRHVVGVRDGSSAEARLYVDGTLVHSQSTAGLIGGDFVSSTAGLDLGWLNLQHGYHFGGALDEVAIYDHALSDEEIQAHYDIGSAGLPLCDTGASPPQMVVGPADLTVSELEPAMFAIQALGTFPLAYQWRSDGVEIPDATSRSFTLSSASVTDSGRGFDVVVSNAFGMITSVVAILTVTQPSPIPTAGLALWLRADAGVQLNEEGVMQWNDQSGQERHVTQPVASSQPRFIPGMVDGWPTLRFDGIDDSLGGILPVNGLQGLTVFLVAANAQDQTDGPTYLEHAAVFWNEIDPWCAVYVSPFQSSVAVRFGTTQPNNLMVYTRPVSLSSLFSLTTALKDRTTDSVFVNGSLVLSQTDRLTTIAGSEDTVHLGQGYQATFFDGEIAELLVYQRALTPQERETVEQHLSSKYDLASEPPPVQDPTLNIRQTEEQVIVTWPPCPGCVLEETADLNAPASWLPVHTSEGNEENAVTLPITSGHRFLRLRVR